MQKDGMVEEEKRMVKKKSPWAPSTTYVGKKRNTANHLQRKERELIRQIKVYVLHGSEHAM